MLTDFPTGFGFDPTVMGQRKSSYIAGGRRSSRTPRATVRTAPLPVILVDDELVPIDPQREEAAPHDSVAQSPFLTTALVGLMLAGAGYFVGFR